MSKPGYDVVIVGGGPVGLAMAAALSGSMPGIAVALLDRRPFGPSTDQRASAIGAGAQRVFEQLGLWSRMTEGAQPVRRMKITDSGVGDISRPLFLNFEGEVAPGQPFAHMVPNRGLNAALLAAVEGKAELIAPVEIVSFTAAASAARLELKDGRALTAPLVIAADGAQSPLRNIARIGTFGHDYGQVGIVTTITHELDHDGTAFEHFRPNGPFASLPLSGHRSSLVWTETADNALRIRALPREAAAAEIEAVMGMSLGAVTVDEGLQGFPLKLQIAREFVGPRLALIGDAAHVIHPVAGQGLNLGLKDVAALAEAIVDALRLGLDPGAADNLARYQRWRRFDTTLMAMVTDGMNRMLSNDLAPLRAARDLGLGVVDRLPMLKDFMIARAAGVDRTGPKLLRGLPI